MRGVTVDTGYLRFTVLPDRCMDIGACNYMGNPVSWISATGYTAPEFYDPEGFKWLRGFFGGLVTTCGLKNVGVPTAEYGLHGRAANTPAERVAVTSEWVGDDYVMQVKGRMRECAVFGEKLVLERTLTTKLLSNSFTLEDRVVNEGFKDEKVALCYHCNFGYPLVDENAVIFGVPEELSKMAEPAPVEEQCIGVPLEGDVVTTGIRNEKLGMEASITHRRDSLPEYLIWKMFGQSEYVVGLEPRTTNFGGDDIEKNGGFRILRPFEEFTTHVEFKFRKI